MDINEETDFVGISKIVADESLKQVRVQNAPILENIPIDRPEFVETDQGMRSNDETWFPITLNLPNGNSTTTNPALLAEQEELKRQRMIKVAFGLLLLMIIIIFLIGMANKKTK